jgi:hypothetical protein
VADKETFLVVIRVNEPTSDSVGPIAADFAGVGVEHVNAVHFHADFAVLFRQNRNVRLAEDDKKISLAGVFQVIGHVQVGIHSGFKHRDVA